MPVARRMLEMLEESRAAAAAAVCALVIAIGLNAYRVVSNYHTPSKEDYSRHGLIDFHHGVYFPGRGFREGINPYGPEYVDHYPLRRPMALYSPATPLFAAPLSLLPLRLSNVVYFCLNVVLIVGLSWFALRAAQAPSGVGPVAALATLLLVSRPGHINQMLGQIALPLVLGAWAALHWGASRPGRAAFGLLATSIKPTFGIPLIWLTWSRGNRWAAVAGAALAMLAASVAVAIGVARSGWSQWSADLQFAASYVETSRETIPTESWTRIDGMVALSRVVGANPNSAATAALAATLLLGGGWFCRRLARSDKLRHDRADGLDSRPAVLACLVTLVCVYHNSYDALLLVAPAVAIAVGRAGEAYCPWQRRSLLILIAVLFANYATTRTVLERLSLSESAEMATTTLNSGALWLALIIALPWGQRSQFSPNDDSRPSSDLKVATRIRPRR